jgi:hypothetical protein
MLFVSWRTEFMDGTGYDWLPFAHESVGMRSRQGEGLLSPLNWFMMQMPPKQNREFPQAAYSLRPISWIGGFTGSSEP